MSKHACVLAQDGCLVAMWVTNRERHQRFIYEELLPHWGLQQVATWSWLKVTNSGELVSPLVNTLQACTVVCETSKGLREHFAGKLVDRSWM